MARRHTENHTCNHWLQALNFLQVNAQSELGASDPVWSHEFCIMTHLASTAAKAIIEFLRAMLTLAPRVKNFDPALLFDRMQQRLHS